MRGVGTCRVEPVLPCYLSVENVCHNFGRRRFLAVYGKNLHYGLMPIRAFEYQIWIGKIVSKKDCRAGCEVTERRLRCFELEARALRISFALAVDGKANASVDVSNDAGRRIGR